MSRLASASTPTTTFPSIRQPKIQTRLYTNPCNSVFIPRTQICSSDLSLTSSSFFGVRKPQRSSIICRSSTGPGTPGSDDNESRNVLDAFFLGKALAEAVNERIESAIGEIFGTIGRLQAEQQKQVLDFQEKVLERAKKAKQKAAQGAMEAQGLIPKPAAASAASVVNGAVSKASPSTDNDIISANSSSDTPATSAATTNRDPDLDTPGTPAANTDPDPDLTIEE